MTTQIVLTCHYDDHRAATLYMGDGGESPLTPFHLGVGGDICTNGYYIDVSKSFYAYFFNDKRMYFYADGKFYDVTSSEWSATFKKVGVFSYEFDLLNGGHEIFRRVFTIFFGDPLCDLCFFPLAVKAISDEDYKKKFIKNDDKIRAYVKKSITWRAAGISFFVFILLLSIFYCFY